MRDWRWRPAPHPRPPPSPPPRANPQSHSCASRRRWPCAVVLRESCHRRAWLRRPYRAFGTRLDRALPIPRSFGQALRRAFLGGVHECARGHRRLQLQHRCPTRSPPARSQPCVCKSPSPRTRARALAIDRLAASCQRDCIVRGASDYGSHPSRLDGKDLHQAIAKIVLAACEYLRPSKLPQRVNAKAGSSG